MITLTIICPEKGDLTLKLQFDSAGTTLADLAEVLEQNFSTGSYQACYFTTLSSKPGDYLDNSNTIDELDLKSSEYKLLAYIKNKKDIWLTFIFPEKNDQIIKIQLDSVKTLADLADGFEKMFGTGADQACYFRTLSSKPEDYLDNSTTIHELDLKNSEYRLLAYIKNKKDILLMRNKFPAVTFIFPEKNDQIIKMQLEPDTTLAGIAEGFEKRFMAGADQACYFRTLSSKPGDYLDSSKPIDELDLKSSEYKLLAYIKNKKDVCQSGLETNKMEDTSKITLRIQSNQGKMSIAVPLDCTIRDIAEVFRGSQNLNANIKLEIYKENNVNPLEQAMTVENAMLRDQDVLVAKKKFTGA